MSGVEPGDPIVLHRYENGQTLCGGSWHATGMSPCELTEANHLAGLAELPPCEASDEDIKAAAALLGIPKASRCWTKDRASFDDPVLKPEAVLTIAMLQAQLISLDKAISSVSGLNDLLVGTAPASVLSSSKAIQRVIDRFTRRA